MRFPEFEGEWDFELFSDLFTFLSNNTLSRAELSETGNIRNIHYGDILVKYTDVINVDDEIIPFVSNASESKVRCGMLRTGDVIIADTAEDATVGKAIEIINYNNKPVVSGLHTMPCRPNRDFTASFLGYYINSNAYHSQLYPYMQGIKVTSISKANIGKTLIHFPSRSEQKKIVELFNLIEKNFLIQKKLVKALKLYKRGLLSKLFPQKGKSVPQYRFAGFTDAWEQCKLGDTLCSLQNNTLSRAELTYEEGTIKNVHYGDILVKYGEILDVKNEQIPNIIDTTVAKKYKASFLQNGDVIFADTAEDETVGKCSEIAGLTDETALSGLHTIPYRPQLKFATGYLGYYLNSSVFHQQLIPLMQGIKVTSISKSAMQNTDIVYPKSFDEQEKIGTYFMHLDHLITLHQQKYSKMQSIKKFMLQNMFV